MAKTPSLAKIATVTYVKVLHVGSPGRAPCAALPGGLVPPNPTDDKGPRTDARGGHGGWGARWRRTKFGPTPSLKESANIRPAGSRDFLWAPHIHNGQPFTQFPPGHCSLYPLVRHPQPYPKLSSATRVARSPPERPRGPPWPPWPPWPPCLAVLVSEAAATAAVHWTPPRAAARPAAGLPLIAPQTTGLWIDMRILKEIRSAISPCPPAKAPWPRLR